MKNRASSWSFLILMSAVSLAALLPACQRVKLEPYTKFETAENVPRITLEDAKKDYDAGVAVIIDSRGEAQYKQEHITGALNIPIGSPPERFSEIPKGKKIIVYCS